MGSNEGQLYVVDFPPLFWIDQVGLTTKINEGLG